jgi:sortase A
MADKEKKNSKKRLIIRIVGSVLIVAGIIIIAYPFYTNFVMKRKEVDVLASWDDQILDLQSTTATTEDSDPELKKESIDVDTSQKVPFKISIPDIGSEWVVNEGTDTATLKEGPGHLIGSALPGEDGKCVVAGHRTTYGAPFNRVDELEKGDQILIETLGNERFIYLVEDQFEVLPSDLSVLDPVDEPVLLLSTCTPKYYATRRLIIYAELDESGI